MFKGIPYAFGAHWCAVLTHAEAHPGWQGVRNATFQSGLYTAPLSEGSFFANRLILPAKIACTLNVWSPMSKTKPLPVMVWIHGGALPGDRVQ